MEEAKEALQKRAQEAQTKAAACEQGPDPLPAPDQAQHAERAPEPAKGAGENAPAAEQEAETPATPAATGAAASACADGKENVPLVSPVPAKSPLRLSDCGMNFLEEGAEGDLNLLNTSTSPFLEVGNLAN